MLSYALKVFSDFALTVSQGQSSPSKLTSNRNVSTRHQNISNHQIPSHHSSICGISRLKKKLAGVSECMYELCFHFSQLKNLKNLIGLMKTLSSFLNHFLEVQNKWRRILTFKIDMRSYITPIPNSKIFKKKENLIQHHLTGNLFAQTSGLQNYWRESQLNGYRLVKVSIF